MAGRQLLVNLFRRQVPNRGGRWRVPLRRIAVTRETASLERREAALGSRNEPALAGCRGCGLLRWCSRRCRRRRLSALRIAGADGRQHADPSAGDNRQEIEMLSHADAPLFLSRPQEGGNGGAQRVYRKRFPLAAPVLLGHTYAREYVMRRLPKIGVLVGMFLVALPSAADAQ